MWPWDTLVVHNHARRDVLFATDYKIMARSSIGRAWEQEHAIYKHVVD
jgi:hypothetical protein